MTNEKSIDPNEIGNLIRSAKTLAKRYRELTGRPLGITGEVAEYEAARLLGLKLARVRNPGYDVIRNRDDREVRLQVKGRCVITNRPGQRLGSIDLKKQWDGVLLVLLDEQFEPTEIYEAARRDIEKALSEPGSKARDQRGALTVSKFKKIGRKIWPRR